MKNIAVLISGGGTNLQAIIDSVENGSIDGKIVAVISNKESAYGLTRAKNHGIESFFSDDETEIISILTEKKVDLVVLAGYLKILGEGFIREFENRIINIHPSLIPSFCGKGYYGLKVHEAAIEYGVKLTGATVHFVDENADTGPIIIQRAVEVLADDTPKILQERVLRVEHEIMCESVALFCKGKVRLEGRKVYIDK